MGEYCVLFQILGRISENGDVGRFQVCRWAPEVSP